MKSMIKGSCVALVTPMTAEGAIDWQALHQLIHWHIEEGTDAIVSLGTTGESAVLSHKERTEVLKQTIAAVNGRIPVIAGTGTNSTQETIELTLEAKDLGANACLLVVPYYNCPSQQGLYMHFKSVADAVHIDQILYNVPSRTVTDMQVETVIQLMEHNNIVGIKEATGNLVRAKQLVDAAADKEFCIYSGDDASALEFMMLGGDGVISVTANVAPNRMHSLCAEVFAGNNKAAEAINQQLAPLNEALFIQSNPIPVKWALEKMGKIEGGIRLPLMPLEDKFKNPVQLAIGKAGMQIAETL